MGGVAMGDHDHGGLCLLIDLEEEVHYVHRVPGVQVPCATSTGRGREG